MEPASPLLNNTLPEDGQPAASGEKAPAYLHRRIPAFCLDLILILLIGGLFRWDRSIEGKAFVFLLFCLIKFIEAVHVNMRGHSIGRRVMKIRLVNEAGRNPGLFRTFLYLLFEMYVIFGLFFPIFKMLWDPERRMWHDRFFRIRAISTETEFYRHSPDALSRITSLAFFDITLILLIAGSLCIYSTVPLAGPVYFLGRTIFSHSSPYLWHDWFFKLTAIPISRNIWIMTGILLIPLLIIHGFMNIGREDRASAGSDALSAERSTGKSGIVRDGVAFYWITGALTALLVTAAAVSLTLHSFISPGPFCGHILGPEQRMTETEKIPDRDIKEWEDFKSFAQGNREALEALRRAVCSGKPINLNDNAEIKQHDSGESASCSGLARKWISMVDIEPRKLIPKGLDFIIRSSYPDYLRWNRGRDVKLFVLRGRSGRAEVLMAVRYRDNTLLIEDLDIAPWNYCRYFRFRNLYIHNSLLVEALREASRISMGKGLRGSITVRQSLLNQILDSSGNDDRAIVLEGWKLSAFEFPNRGGR